jgi:hypothetical protein
MSTISSSDHTTTHHLSPVFHKQTILEPISLSQSTLNQTPTDTEYHHTTPTKALKMHHSHGTTTTTAPRRSFMSRFSTTRRAAPRTTTTARTGRRSGWGNNNRRNERVVVVEEKHHGLHMGTHGGTTAPVHHHKRHVSIGDKISGAMLKLKGSLTHRPGVKAAGTRRMHGTDGRGSRRY